MWAPGSGGNWVGAAARVGGGGGIGNGISSARLPGMEGQNAGLNGFFQRPETERPTFCADNSAGGGKIW